MNEVSVVSDDEREDGEIVDDLEDISEYSIPSCGKSDCQQDLLRTISLSSISASESELECKNDYVQLRKQYRYKNDSFYRCNEDYNLCKRKRRHRKLYYEYPYKQRRHKHRSLSPSSTVSSDSDLGADDKRILLQAAVRVNEIHNHRNSLRTRLKPMIEPGSQEDEEEEDEETLRTLALLTKNPTPVPEKELGVDEQKNESTDSLYDKELAELRLEALKSAVIKKHMERKKKRELNQQHENNLDNAVADGAASNDKENNDSNAIKAAPVPLEGETTSTTTTSANNNNNEEKHDENSLEDDVDVMRAMLLASMSKKITADNKSIATSTPVVQNMKNNVKKRTMKQPLKTNINLPSVKPLIINLKSDSDSEVENSSSQPNESSPIDETVTMFLKKQREQYEAKIAPKDNADPPLDKSVLKLLSKPQQREYQLLKQKLLMASRKRKVRRSSARLKNNENGAASPSQFKKTLQQIQIQKDGRLQMKGKYRELVPLIRKVNVASDRRKQCEEHIKNLLGRLKEARNDLATAHQNFNGLVRELILAKDNIDLRESNIIGSKPNAAEIAKSTTTTTALKTVPKANNAINKPPHPAVKEQKHSELEEDNGEQKENHVIDGKVEKDENNKYTDYVSPLDNRNTVTSNPLQMLCPYELFGVCKDKDCNFNHCP